MKRKLAHDAESDHISPQVIAKTLDITMSGAYSLIAKGEFPSIKIGRLIRVPRAPFQAYLARKLRGGVA